MKYIKKVAVTPIEPATGSIFDGTNITDKSRNTYSANVIDKFNTYSTEEQVVGTWNGKPLYRKMFIIEGLPNNTYQYISGYDYSVCRLVDAYGITYYMDNEQRRYTIPRTGSSYIFVAQDEIGGLYVQTDIDLTETIAEIVVEYTKTTD